MAALSGLALLSASALTRFGVFEAGIHAAKDPRYTVEPQKRGRTPLITVSSVRSYLEGGASRTHPVKGSSRPEKALSGRSGPTFPLARGHWRHSPMGKAPLPPPLMAGSSATSATPPRR